MGGVKIFQCNIWYEQLTYHDLLCDVVRAVGKVRNLLMDSNATSAIIGQVLEILYVATTPCITRRTWWMCHARTVDSWARSYFFLHVFWRVWHQFAITNSIENAVGLRAVGRMIWKYLTISNNRLRTRSKEISLMLQRSRHRRILRRQPLDSTSANFVDTVPSYVGRLKTVDSGLKRRNYCNSRRAAGRNVPSVALFSSFAETSLKLYWRCVQLFHI
jgi:hypothetical protein